MGDYSLSRKELRVIPVSPRSSTPTHEYAYDDRVVTMAVGPEMYLHARSTREIGWFCPGCRCIVTYVNPLASGDWTRRLERQIVKHEFYIHNIPISGNMP